MTADRSADRTADHIAETVDHAGIERLQRAYADVVNRRDWPALEDLFTADATLDLDLVTSEPRRIVGPAAIGDFIGRAVERFAFFQFVILNSHVDLGPDGDADAATVRLFMCELRQAVDETGRVDAFGLYRDRYVRLDGGWRFAHRRYRSMGRFPPGDVFPLPVDLS